VKVKAAVSAPLPKVKNARWSKHPVDRFVLAQMGSKGLAPEAEADKHTLLRRASLDLTGLPPTPDEVEAFLAACEHVQTNATSDAGWDSLRDRLAGREGVVRAFYLAVAPRFFGPICERVGAFGLVTPKSRVVIEKPIGRDLESARLVNDAVGAVFDERQVFRIDHYLGKETVQNLMALRFANALYEPLWNAAHIDHVQITVAESIGVGGRGGYYETAGALRDMVQNHMLQLLCLVAMEPPDSYEADSLRDEKLKVLKALRPITADRVSQVTVRGQYTGLRSDSTRVPSYVEEAGVARSTTETFVALKVEVGNWRWASVPFYLRTGKRMPARVSEIVVAFRPIPHSIFPERMNTKPAMKFVAPARKFFIAFERTTLSLSRRESNPMRMTPWAAPK
jgi:glucose-6-phosphate 1-dehydrogenase